jgi:hypothetical protein
MFLVKVVCITHHGNVISIHSFTYYAAFKTKVVSPTIICHIMMCSYMFWPQCGHPHGGLQQKEKAVADSVKDMHMWSQKYNIFK